MHLVEQTAYLFNADRGQVRFRKETDYFLDLKGFGNYVIDRNRVLQALSGFRQNDCQSELALEKVPCRVFRRQQLQQLSDVTLIRHKH